MAELLPGSSGENDGFKSVWAGQAITALLGKTLMDQNQGHRDRDWVSGSGWVSHLCWWGKGSSHVGSSLSIGTPSSAGAAEPCLASQLSQPPVLYPWALLSSHHNCLFLELFSGLLVPTWCFVNRHQVNEPPWPKGPQKLVLRWKLNSILPSHEDNHAFKDVFIFKK
jgi:hypothetical protein